MATHQHLTGAPHVPPDEPPDLIVRLLAAARDLSVDADLRLLLGEAAAELDSSDAEVEQLHGLADSEGARAVEYLRRARRAEKALLALANAADAVGVAYFDTDTIALDVAAMQDATEQARSVLAAAPRVGWSNG